MSLVRIETRDIAGSQVSIRAQHIRADHVVSVSTPVDLGSDASYWTFSLVFGSGHGVAYGWRCADAEEMCHSAHDEVLEGMREGILAAGGRAP